MTGVKGEWRAGRSRGSGKQHSVPCRLFCAPLLCRFPGVVLLELLVGTKARGNCAFVANNRTALADAASAAEFADSTVSWRRGAAEALAALAARCLEGKGAMRPTSAQALLPATARAALPSLFFSVPLC